MGLLVDSIKAQKWTFAKTYAATAPHEYFVRTPEPEELIRLKHITGFSKLFADSEYKRSWETKTQIMLKKANPINAKKT